ncbi:hypothetical protein SESBI_45970 [Sesbania bispinosa]|nr:hypothetical protein SESBI_45970 [Sesbania bispinosa]
MDTHSFEAVFDPQQDHIQVSHTFVDSVSHDLSDGYVILIDPKGNCFHLTLGAGSNRAR